MLHPWEFSENGTWTPHDDDTNILINAGMKKFQDAKEEGRDAGRQQILSNFKVDFNQMVQIDDKDQSEKALRQLQGEKKRNDRYNIWEGLESGKTTSFFGQSVNASSWLASSYEVQYGKPATLNWHLIIEGIIEEHVITRGGDEKFAKAVDAIWKTFLEASGVEDLQRRIETNDPESPDVKTIFIMYSLESFIYKTLNFAGRNEDQSKVKTMGPYALALT